MSASSGGRSGGVVVLQVLLAMLFLAIIGATVGYLLGEQHNKRTNAARPTGASTTDGGSSSGTNPRNTGGPSPSGTHCPSHTEGLAGKSLIQVLHLHTTKGTDVWICQATDGTLYYQGRRAGSSEFQEKVNALFLTDVTYENGEYVARNYNPDDGSTTEYRVTAQRLVIVYLNYASPKPNSTEVAAS